MTSQTAHGQPDNENTMMHQTNSAFRGAFFMGGSMIKRFFLALLLTAGLLSPSLAAGTITISLTQRLDNSTHLPLSGGKIYFIQAGTTSTPQNAYQDSALTLPYANPLTLDSGGNIPQLFFADGVIKIRITNSVGVQQIVQDNIQVTGASSGGGGGGTVDPTTILATGDMKVTYGTGVISGFVRANGRTIGSATSGATERANADTSALFLYLWGADANLAVSGGRGVSAAADYAANKTIALPDLRGRTLAGLDDMGNSAAGRLTSTYWGAGSTTLGGASGAESRAVAQSNLPAYSPPITVTLGSHTHTQQVTTFGIPNTAGGLQVVTSVVASGGTSGASMGSATSGDTAALTSPLGSGTPIVTLPPTMLATIYVKL